MKIALLADIHGNHHALSCVLKATEKAGCKRLLIVGDFVGYYYHPNRVFELLEGWEYDSVKGNHEAMLLQSIQNPEKLATYTRKYGSGLEYAIRKLGDRQIAYINSLQDSRELDIDGVKIMLCHGSPFDIDQYVYPDANEKKINACNAVNRQILVMGHTHYPMLKEVDGKMIINPGSVGQPRDRIPGACWASLDTETLEVEFHRERYDNASLVREVTELDPDIPYLAEVLTRQ